MHSLGCITVMKAMASGCIPITSRYKDSVLFNLTDGFDLGPSKALDNGMRYSEWLNLWVQSVLQTANFDKKALKKYRIGMRTAVRSKFSWRNTAEILQAHWK
jgi:glycosyltransferase involved in cell wall biosynthesis